MKLPIHGVPNLLYGNSFIFLIFAFLLSSLVAKYRETAKRSDIS